MTLADAWIFVKRAAPVVAVCAGLAGLFDIAWKLRERAETDRIKTILEWEEPTVFTIVATAGTEGITFQTLQQQLRTLQLTVEGVPISKHEESDLALQRVLLSLVAKKAIVPVGINKFRAASEADLCGCQSPASEIVNKLVAPALECISGVNGQKDVVQILHEFRERFKIKEGESQILLNNLIFMREVGVEQGTRKVWNLLTSTTIPRDIEGNSTIIFQPVPMPTGPPMRRPRTDPDDNFIPRTSPDYAPPPQAKPKPETEKPTEPDKGQFRRGPAKSSPQI